jgi:hypothetical protein
MKKIELKKVAAAIVWNGLKSTPPKEFPTMGEIESASRVIEDIEKAIPEFVDIIKGGEEIKNEMMKSVGQKLPASLQKKREEYMRKSTEVETKKGKEMVKIEFEDDDFNNFFQQCERWGKNWFTNIGGLMEFRKCLTDANSKPKK